MGCACRSYTVDATEKENTAVPGFSSCWSPGVVCQSTRWPLRQRAGSAGKQQVQRSWGSRLWGFHGDSVGGGASQAAVCRTLRGILLSFIP